jgi:two-component system response regulator DevR
VITVFVVDDHDPVRRGLEELIETAGDMTVVGDAGSATDALERIRLSRPDVAVLDARLPDGSGIDVCRAITTSVPETRCLILTCFDDDDARSAALEAGASAFVIKEICGVDLLDAIREVASGHPASPR